MHVLGIDVGGSGVKGAPVNTETGEILAERHRIETPQPATPDAVVATIAEIAAFFAWTGPIGLGFPAVVKNGVVHTAANIDESWIGVNAEQQIKAATGAPTVAVLNDADAAAIAEMRLGAGKEHHQGIVLTTTLGTGVGTAFFVDGRLFPNCELGHVTLAGDKHAESYMSEAARDRENLSWKKWAKRLNLYYQTMENLFWPDLIIVGGGVSKKHDKFLPLLDLRTPIVPAQMLNEAGIIGAALAAAEAVTETVTEAVATTARNAVKKAVATAEKTTPAKPPTPRAARQRASAKPKTDS